MPRRRTPRVPRSLRTTPLTFTCHRPVPRLPSGVTARDVAWGARRHEDVLGNLAWSPIVAETLPARARRRLLARATIRYGRIWALRRILHRELFWLHAELRLGLAGSHPSTGRCWWHRLGGRSFIPDLTEWHTLAALIAPYEPAADRWLRRQLAELTAPAPGRPRPDRPEATGGTP